MHRMGGLRKHMPRTYVTFLAGAAALSGLPLMSGYFSKDEILAHTFVAGGYYQLLWVVGIGAAAMTAFYTWRMVALTFFGPERFDHHHVHPHESPLSMTGPLMVLALLSVLGGLLGLAPVVGELIHVPHLLTEWLAPVVEPGKRVLELSHGPHGHPGHTEEWILLGLGAVIALYFAHRGFRAYLAGTERDERLAREKPALQGFLTDAWRIDSGYQNGVVLPTRLVAFVTAVVVDQFAIDGLVNGCATAARAVGQRSRKLADGDLRSYALWIGAGAVLISFLWMWA
jgi:NADH-quinone oxidoreductase subunit L